MNEHPEYDEYDAIVIGTGFAGAVTACRLAEAGLRICVLERGRRFRAKEDFPSYDQLAETSNVPPDDVKDGRDPVQPDVSRLFWRLGNGLWDFRDLGGVLVGQAAGFGGGSLIYANVHMRPPAHVFDKRWPLGRTELEPYYDLAARMLRVTLLPDEHAGLPKKVQLERAARRLDQLQFEDCKGGPHAYLRAFAPPIAVNFAGDGVGGQGVCDLGGNCCFGCPVQAKNTLDLNYLAEAEKHGAEIRTLAEVVSVEQRDGGGFHVEYCNHLARKQRESLLGKRVFLCAGAVNTTELLLRCREAEKIHPSGAGLGTRFHPNQDVLAAVFDCEEPQELDRGPTITASLVYDREPGDLEPAARWRLGFDGAAFEPRVGSEIRCGAENHACVAAPPYLISGSYEGGNASGEITLSELRGTFEPGASLTVDREPWGRVVVGADKLRSWFLVQDGGLPTAIEPALGVFRSPLWLARNAFREQQRPVGEDCWPPKASGGTQNAGGHGRAREADRLRCAPPRVAHGPTVRAHAWGRRPTPPRSGRARPPAPALPRRWSPRQRARRPVDPDASAA